MQPKLYTLFLRDVTIPENVKEWGQIVVDRKFMSEKNRELYFGEGSNA